MISQNERQTMSNPFFAVYSAKRISQFKQGARDFDMTILPIPFKSYSMFTSDLTLQLLHTSSDIPVGASRQTQIIKTIYFTHRLICEITTSGSPWAGFRPYSQIIGKFRKLIKFYGHFVKRQK